MRYEFLLFSLSHVQTYPIPNMVEKMSGKVPRSSCSRGRLWVLVAYPFSLTHSINEEARQSDVKLRLMSPGVELQGNRCGCYCQHPKVVLGSFAGYQPLSADASYTRLSSPNAPRASAFPSVGFVEQESQLRTQVGGGVNRSRGDGPWGARAHPGIRAWFLLTSGLAECVGSMLCFPGQAKWPTLATLVQRLLKGIQDGPSSQKACSLGTTEGDIEMSYVEHLLYAGTVPKVLGMCLT